MRMNAQTDQRVCFLIDKECDSRITRFERFERPSIRDGRDYRIVLRANNASFNATGILSIAHLRSIDFESKEMQYEASSEDFLSILDVIDHGPRL